MLLSNGAVAGALMGCKFGFKNLPEDLLNFPHRKWLDRKVQQFLKTIGLTNEQQEDIPDREDVTIEHSGVDNPPTNVATGDSTVTSNPITNPPGDDVTDLPSDDVTNPPSDDVTNPPSDDVTNPPRDDVTNPPRDDVTNPPRDDVTNPPSDDVTNPPRDDVTNPPSDDVTNPSHDDVITVPSKEQDDGLMEHCSVDNSTDLPTDNAIVVTDVFNPTGNDITDPCSDNVTPMAGNDVTTPPSADAVTDSNNDVLTTQITSTGEKQDS